MVGTTWPRRWRRRRSLCLVRSRAPLPRQSLSMTLRKGSSPGPSARRSSVSWPPSLVVAHTNVSLITQATNPRYRLMSPSFPPSPPLSFLPPPSLSLIYTHLPPLPASPIHFGLSLPPTPQSDNSIPHHCILRPPFPPLLIFRGSRLPVADVHHLCD